MSIAGSIAALVRGFTSILRRQPPLPGVDLVSASLRSAADGHGVAAYLYRFLSGLDHLRRDDFASALVDLEAAISLSAAIGGWFQANTRIVAALAALSSDDPLGAGDWLAAIEVEDSGEGVAEADRERVFEPFHRLASSKQPGVGLGLSIVRDIARAHGARIDLGDGAGGIGLKVRVRFPPPASPASAPR